MKKQLQLIWLSGMAILLSSPVKAEVTCTATPNCATLGYTKNADQCPNGGIKCPFDANKMFCLRGGGDGTFVFQNDVKLYDLVYADGSTSKTYDSSKGLVGMAISVHPGTKRHAIVMSLQQPPAQSYAQAKAYCAGNSFFHFPSGDWYMAGAGELALLSNNNVSGGMTAINNALDKIPGAQQITQSFSPAYCKAGSADYSKTYLDGSPSCADKPQTVSFNACNTRYADDTAIRCTGNGYNKDCDFWTGSKACPAFPFTSIYASNVYWSITTKPGATANTAYIINLDNGAISESSGASYGHFRCVIFL